MEEDQDLQNPFPSPPSHYTNYTAHNVRLLALLNARLSEVAHAAPASDAELLQQQRDLLANETDVPDWPLLQLARPRVDWILEDGAYNAFGDTWFTKERIPSLAEMGGTQLYPEDPTVDRRPALQSVLKTLLLTYSNFLASILAPPPPASSTLPPDWQRLADWMRVMGQNIMGAANDLRPVQARGNLEAMMARQLELRRAEARAIHAKCDALEARLEQLRARAAALASPQEQEPPQNPTADPMDVDTAVQGASGGSEASTPRAPAEEDTADFAPHADSEQAVTLAQVTEEDVLRWAEEAG